MRGSDPSSAAYADCHRNFIFSSTWPFVCLPTPFFPFFFHYSLVSSTTSLGFRWTASHVDLFSLSNFSLAPFPSFSLNDSLVTDGLDNRTLTGWTVNIYIYISSHCDDQFLPNFLPEACLPPLHLSRIQKLVLNCRDSRTLWWVSNVRHSR